MATDTWAERGQPDRFRDPSGIYSFGLERNGLTRDCGSTRHCPTAGNKDQHPAVPPAQMRYARPVTAQLRQLGG
ncbi:hypothetical protein GCM10009681_52170 [Luedemannella helvata]|uniref:Uncharacterized protein n=1 Tax=Luedemannella helvata TaxID=349315 RepID=A0ABN2L680_9ACTN